MSKAAVARLSTLFGSRILATSDFRGDDEVRVAAEDWLACATELRRDPELAMDHFLDLTAIDWPEREPEEPRFDVLLTVRNATTGRRVRLRTRVAEAASVASVTGLWAGANWAEREVFDMFGIRFDGHPDLRRILMYDEFVGHPLRKDYPIDRAQPLVPYREVEGVFKLAPFGIEEGQPFSRVRWEDRLAGEDHQVSPSIALQQTQRRALSDSEAAAEQDRRLAEKRKAASIPPKSE